VITTVIGKMLAHYKITRLLGEGGMGVVYEAEDSRLKRRVALKILSDRVAQDPRLLERFQREAEALATPIYLHYTPRQLSLDPLFDPLRGHPGFQELLED
jgi:serine/threonine protein kinase